MTAIVTLTGAELRKLVAARTFLIGRPCPSASAYFSIACSLAGLRRRVQGPMAPASWVFG